MNKNLKNWSFTIFLFVAFNFHSYSQFLNRLKESVKEAAENHVENDATNATNKTIDKIEHPKIKKDKDNKDSQENPSISSNQPTENNKDITPIKTYQNYDFVPGDTIIFTDNFLDDMDGEFPAHWKLKSGQAIVQDIKGEKAFCLTDGNYCVVIPRMKNENYLGNAFTIEFDTYCDEDNSSQDSPQIYFTYMDKEGDISDEAAISFNKGAPSGGYGSVSAGGNGFENTLSAEMPEELKNNYPNKWHHCALIYKNNQMKAYIDQYRILTIPDVGIKPLSFGFQGVGDMNHPIVISNVRVASGGNMNMIGKKFTDTKIITHGITFDVDKSTLKPQSMGTLNMIVKIMNNNPDIKFEIDGHTDNSGDPTHNMMLSQQRAEAVKTELVNLGINGDRLTTKGFGASKPISDNDTPEGKANNRRVEFIKL